LKVATIRYNKTSKDNPPVNRHHEIVFAVHGHDGHPPLIVSAYMLVCMKYK